MCKPSFSPALKKFNLLKIVSSSLAERRMYRRDYPDIPGMFDARFSEYNRPSFYREIQSTGLISIIGKKPKVLTVSLKLG
jgi:hypothetical protein